MKRTAQTAITIALMIAAVLIASIIIARAEEPWRANLHSCNIVKTFALKDKTAAGSTLYGDTVMAGPNNVLNDDVATVFLRLEDVLAIQKELPALKKCDAFYKCVAKRDWRRYTPDAPPKGPIPKHCYEARR
jgi:hypothetical protein